MPHNYQVSPGWTSASGCRRHGWLPSACQPPTLRPAGCAALAPCFRPWMPSLGIAPKVRVPDVRPLNRSKACTAGHAAGMTPRAEKGRSAVRTLKSLDQSPAEPCRALSSLAEPRHMHDSMHLNAPTSQADVFLVRGSSSYLLARSHARTHAHGSIRTDGPGMTWTCILSLSGWAYVSDLFRKIPPLPALPHSARSSLHQTTLPSALSPLPLRVHTYKHTSAHTSTAIYTLTFLFPLVLSCRVWVRSRSLNPHLSHDPDPDPDPVPVPDLALLTRHRILLLTYSRVSHGPPLSSLCLGAA